MNSFRKCTNCCFSKGIHCQWNSFLLSFFLSDSFYFSFFHIFLSVSSFCFLFLLSFSSLSTLSFCLLFFNFLSLSVCSLSFSYSLGLFLQTNISIKLDWCTIMNMHLIRSHQHDQQLPSFQSYRNQLHTTIKRSTTSLWTNRWHKNFCFRKVLEDVSKVQAHWTVCCIYCGIYEWNNDVANIDLLLAPIF